MRQQLLRLEVNNFGHPVEVMIGRQPGDESGKLDVNFRLVTPTPGGIDALLAERQKFEDDNDDWLGSIVKYDAAVGVDPRRFLEKTEGRGVLHLRHFPQEITYQGPSDFAESSVEDSVVTGNEESPSQEFTTPPSRWPHGMK